MSLPLVSVVIRTQSRPTFLARALASVLAQTHPHWEAIVVNDGGPSHEVEQVITSIFSVDDRRITSLHLPCSEGRSKAAQRGLTAATGTYAAFLDDDDTWETTFLTETVATMTHKGLQAVATHVSLVSEEFTNNTIAIRGKKLHRPSKDRVLLFELAQGNFLPIHSCVFDRKIALEVGGIDASLPLLEDWDFFLRLAERSEIGMIRKPLANYHQRIGKGSDPSQANTVVSGRTLCTFCENYIRNKYLRRDLASGRYGLGMILNMAQATRDLSLWRLLKNDLTRLKKYVSRMFTGALKTQ